MRIYHYRHDGSQLLCVFFVLDKIWVSVQWVNKKHIFWFCLPVCKPKFSILWKHFLLLTFLAKWLGFIIPILDSSNNCFYVFNCPPTPPLFPLTLACRDRVRKATWIKPVWHKISKLWLLGFGCWCDRGLRWHRMILWLRMNVQ